MGHEKTDTDEPSRATPRPSLERLTIRRMPSEEGPARWYVVGPNDAEEEPHPPDEVD